MGHIVEHQVDTPHRGCLDVVHDGMPHRGQYGGDVDGQYIVQRGHKEEGHRQDLKLCARSRGIARKECHDEVNGMDNAADSLRKQARPSL